MALVDSNYRFLYVDVGCNGRVSDGGVFRGCSLQQSLEQKTANIPELLSPYTIVADETFPLKEYILQPYPESLTQEQRIFNYR